MPPAIESWAANVHPEDIERARQYLEDYLAGRIDRYAIDLRLRCKDGDYKWILCRGIVAARDDAGQPLRMIGVHTDIGERKAAEQALIDARNEADRANQAKSEFLSNMSHELRTPLNAILGFTQLLQDDENLSEDQQDSLQAVIKAGQHLLGLINEVLDLAKVEAGHVDLTLEPVAVAPLIHECLDLVAPQADRCAVTLEQAGSGEAFVRADRTRMKQVLLNLLSNAIKYNREGGSVQIDVQPAERGHWRIGVSDTGPGIPAERLGELFQPFNRLGAESNAIEGTGIGLVITRRLVEMMGGSIGVESTVGVGTRFSIHLPAAWPTAAEAGSSHGLDSEAASPTAAERQATVLYIEDNPTNLKLVTRIFARRRQIRLLTALTPEQVSNWRRPTGRT
ncbi:sensor histidine kinase [Methylogaea oryzae]|uniref:sensor histidine kinase n=1 Tax=Methylogaea oryzae TaxID=1295382 RepID=UPI0006D169D2|nr:PAS domain-containing sensor histidine kinase [Methylogaea oryzae]